jgi:hypothetical protein
LSLLNSKPANTASGDEVIKAAPHIPNATLNIRPYLTKLVLITIYLPLKEQE